MREQVAATPPPKQYIVSGSEDGRIVWWDVITKEVVHTTKPGVHKEAVLAVAMHPLLPICASASLDAPYAITLWQHRPIGPDATNVAT